MSQPVDQTIRVVVFDGDPYSRVAIENKLNGCENNDIKVVATIDNIEHLFVKVAVQNPSVIVLDIMDQQQCVAVLRAIKRVVQTFQIKVIVHTVWTESSKLQCAVCAKALGVCMVLQKGTDMYDLCDMVRRAACGEFHYDSRIC